MSAARLTGWRDRANELVVVALLVLSVVLPWGLPLGVGAVGVQAGAALAMHAIAVVLVYRSSRVVNFAQVQLGVVSGAVFASLARYDQFLYWAQDVCPPCLRGPVADAPAWAHQLNFWLALGLGLLVAPALGYLVHATVIARFANAPRLPVTVATIGIGGVLSLVARWVTTSVRDSHSDVELAAAGGPGLTLPFQDVRVEIAPSVFGLADIATFVVAGLAGVLLYLLLQRSRLGAVLRGAAENPQRAGTLGIDANRAGGIVWSVAATLSALAAMLAEAGGLGFGSDVDATVRILAVLALARFTSLPLALVAAVALQVFEQAFLWQFRSPTGLAGVLLVVIALALTVQRDVASRAQRATELAWRGSSEIRPIPRELRDLPVVVAWLRWGSVTLLAVLLALPFVLSPSQTSLAAVFMIQGLVGLSLLILTGWAGQVSLGQFAFAAIGAYATALSAGTLHLPFLLAVVVGASVGAVAAVLVGLPGVRLRGMNLAITTLALSLATFVLVVNPDSWMGSKLPELLPRPRVLGVDMEDERAFYYLTFLFLAVTTAACQGIRRSRAGKVLIATRDNEAAALSYGVDLTRIRLSAYAASGFVAGGAGGLFAYHEHGVKALAFEPGASVGSFLMVVIGGLGSVAGPLLGAAYYGTLTLVGGSWVTLLGTGLGSVIVLVAMPGGLAGALAAGRDAMLRRVALRQRILVPSLFQDSRGKTLDSPAPIAPPRGVGAGYVPRRYRALDDQWGVQHDEMSAS